MTYALDPSKLKSLQTWPQKSQEGDWEASSWQFCVSILAPGQVLAAHPQGLTWAWPAGFHDQHQSTCQPNPRTRSRSLTYQVHLPRVLVQHLMIRVTPMLPKRENVVASRGQWRVTHGIFPPGTESRHPGHTWRRCMTWHLTPQWSYHHWSRGMNAVVSLPWPWQGLQRGSYNPCTHISSYYSMLQWPSVNYCTLRAVNVQFLNARCFHMFFAFFHKKQRCRLKLDDSVTRKKARGRRRTEAFTHTGAFTQRSLYTKEIFTYRRFYTEKPLLKGAFADKCLGAFTHRSFYTKKPLHRGFFTHRRVCTQKPLHREAFTHRSVYTQKRLHTARFYTHRGFYTEKPLHRGVFLHTEGFTQRSLSSKELLHTNVLELLHTKSVAQRSLYSFNTQTRLHTETFTQRSLYTESVYTWKLLHTEKSLHRRAFTQTSFHTQKEACTQRSLYTEKLLHTETFAHKSFYTERSLHRGAFTRSNKLKLAAVL